MENRRHNQSGYHLYAIGTAVKDLQPGEIELEVLIYEVMGDYSAEYDKEGKTKPKKMKGKAKYGDKTIVADINREATIKARWVNGSQNRITPPMVYQGETVKVYKYGQTDRYYWTPFHLEKDLRRKETVVNAYSNLDKEKKSDFGKHYDEKTSYFTKISTKEKMLQLKTATNDKEKTGFNLYLDTKNGIAGFETTAGHSISYDVTKGTFDINTPNLNINSKNANIKSKNINMEGNLSVDKGITTMYNATEFHRSTNFKAPTRLHANALTEHKDIVK